MAARADREAPIHPALIEGIVEAAAGPFGFSRALTPEVRRQLSDRPDAREFPAVRGRTVVPAVFEYPVVVGHPNYLGGFEAGLPAPLIFVTGAWSALQPVPDEATALVMESTHPRSLATRALESARLLAKRVQQLPGVHLAFRPRSPILIVLLPHAVRADALPDTMHTVGNEYPEFPGGLRIELTSDVTPPEITRYAAAIERIIGQEA